jgi:hypothetical protein
MFLKSWTEDGPVKDILELAIMVDSVIHEESKLRDIYEYIPDHLKDDNFSRFFDKFMAAIRPGIIEKIYEVNEDEASKLLDLMKNINNS